MIFQPELVKLIRSGRKTMTRRTVKATRCRYQAGRSYAVQPGRGIASVCRLTITEVRQEPLGALTLRDARREGFRTTIEFYDYWQALYGRVNRDIPVWVIAFSLGDTTDVPRLLAAHPGAPHGDYVSQSYLAMANEPEAIGSFDVERYGKLAHARDLERSGDSMRTYRGQLLAELEQVDGDHRQSWRLKRKLRALDAKIAA